ncbi:Retrovirus-related Pol polyprotein from transposon opus [Ceratobasidium sp. AG-Ba]|nr:Retrovirus-related Pol polyprotein from transposon opus [Ceratobasidium sp. AG-Ba]
MRSSFAFLTRLSEGTADCFRTYGLAAKFAEHTAYRDGQGKWRDANHRFISEEKAKQLIEQATALSQLQTPNPSVSPVPLARSQSSSSLSVSTLGSFASSPTGPAPTQLSEASAIPQGYEPDVESDEAESPRTPVGRTTGVPRPYLPQPNPNDRSRKARQRTALIPKLPQQSRFHVEESLRGPPSRSAAASVLVGPMSVSDALAQIHSLCGGQFYDDGRPKPEVEYRRNFIFATLGLSDEQIASLWANHLVYDGPAYDWYESLISTPAGKTAAEKWSTLQPEIKKRWPTPTRDTKATARRHRAQWREHKFDIQPMREALANESSTTKPHQAWVQQHKALGAAVTSMTNEEKVLQTLETLPVYLLELLPKRDGYVDEWDELIKDIGNISSRLLLNCYNQQLMLDSMYTLSVSEPTQPPATPTWRNARRDRSPPPPVARTPASRREPTVCFDDTPQVAPATAAPSPNLFTRPRTPTSQPRDPPPHTPFTPQTPGPVPSVLSRVPPPVGAQRIPDTPEDKTKWSADVAQWKALYRQEPYSLRRPFPLRPGTYEQTADSCTRCGVADHYSYQCEAAGPDVLDNKEQGYCRLVARKLRDERKAGAQPSTPTPQQRVRETAQLEYSEPDHDPESDLGGKRVGSAPEDGDLVDPNTANEMDKRGVVGLRYDGFDADRTVSFSCAPSIDTRSESILFSPYREQVFVEVGSLDSEGREWPFKMRVWLAKGTGQQGCDVWGTVDGGAMLCVLDSTVWAQIEHSLGSLRSSEVVCRMANSACVPSRGTSTAAIKYGRIVVQNENPKAPKPLQLPDQTSQHAVVDSASEERRPEAAVSADKEPAEVETHTPEEAEEGTLRGVMAVESTERKSNPDALTDILDRAERNQKRRAGPTEIMVNKPISSAQPRPLGPPPPIPDSERKTDPFKPERVAEILGKIRIGEKLEASQKERVEDLIREFADIFAQNLSEVLPVDFTEMKLDIPEGATFPKQAGQQKLTEPQRQALYAMLDDLEEAKIIERVNQDQVAAVSPINMVPKPGGAERPSLRILQQMANSECRKYDLPVEYPDAGFYEEESNFAAVNKVTKDTSSSVSWIASGIPRHSYSTRKRPYTGFYVDGRGHYVYRRMPFGTAAKTVLFMSEATFAGARVSKAGIKANPAKIRAILEWPEPESVLDTMGFLGLAGSQRSKIKNFARIAQPLSDLTRDVRPANLPKGSHKYKKALRDAKVKLDENGQRAFVKLKVALTLDPVLRAPVYNGRPFIVTTDGSKFGFGAVLSQAWEETSQDGKTHKVTYPIAYASKRTSRSEERYIPFLLEFAALKFACNEFDSLIFSANPLKSNAGSAGSPCYFGSSLPEFGQPIELEMDCKALADLLGNNKLNSTHERWRESIIARNIVAVQHLPGKENKACDALSRMYEGRSNTDQGPGRDLDVDPGWEARKELINDLYLLLPDSGVGELLKRFESNEYFSDILLHLLFADDSGNPDDKEAEKERRRRAHRAEGYFVKDGKLWLVGVKNARDGSEVECIPLNEGQQLALSVHEAGGHFGRDMTVLTLQQRYHWPRLRQHATEAVTTCARCKNFGPRLLSALLRPITRSRPFDLLVGDYVALPEGHGGFKTVLVLVDVYSRYLFACASKKPGTGKFTVEALDKISNLLLTPRSFMADGGKHFDCDEVRVWAASRGVQPLKTPPYAPWANGLAEGHIKLLIGRLKKLCAPSVGEDPKDIEDPNTTPHAWPKHLSTAVAQLNDRVVASLGYTPRELITGQLSAERRAEVGRSLLNREVSDADINLGLTYSLRQDAFANALEHAKKRKRKYDARLDKTHSKLRKLAPRWSGPLRVVKKAANSYRLEDLAGNPFTSAAHARLLRPFVPSPGSTLAAYARSLQAARQADKTASKPHTYFSPESLPRSPHPEHRLPLERDDLTQPNNYQDDED